MRSIFINEKDIENILKKGIAEELILIKFKSRKTNRSDILINDLKREIYTELNYDTESIENSFLKAKNLEELYNKFYKWQSYVMLCALLQGLVVYLYITNKITLPYITYLSYFVPFVVVAAVIYVEASLKLISSNMKPLCDIPSVNLMLKSSKITTYSIKNKTVRTDDNITDYDFKKLSDKKKADVIAQERLNNISFFLDRQKIVDLIYKEAYDEVGIKDRDLYFIAAKERVIGEIYTKKLSYVSRLTMAIGLLVTPFVLYHNNLFIITGSLIILGVINWTIVHIYEKHLSQNYGGYFHKQGIIKHRQ